MSITPLSVAISRSATDTLMGLRAELAKTQRELSSGRLADIGLTHGYRTADAMRFRVDELRLTTMRDANALARGRLDVVQTSLAEVKKVGDAYVSALVAMHDSESTIPPTIAVAQSGIGAIFDRLNASYNGAFVFSGMNVDTPPMSEYFSDPSSTARQAVATAFVTAFGFSQTDPAVATITPSAMSAFLAGPFADLFSDPAWGADWSSASDGNMETNISMFETIEASASANHASLRQLTASLVMVADLGLDGMNSDTRRVIITAASEAATTSVGQIARFQGEIGDRQARVAAATERLDIQIGFTQVSLGKMESVDPTEAAVRASDLMQKLEASYELTARIMRLSLLDSI